MTVHAIAQAEFEGFPESKAVSEENPLRQYLRLAHEHGGLVPQALLPAALSRSKQRVSQFINEGRFDVHEIAGMKFVTGRSLDMFMKTERKNGRPVKEKSFTTLVKEGFTAMRDE